MMFRDEYKNEMDNIKPDGYAKYRVRQRISEPEGKRERAPRRGYLTRALAAALSLMIVLSAGFLIGRFTAPELTDGEPALLNAAGSYSKIYKSLEVFRPSIWESFKNYGAEDISENEAVPEGTVGVDTFDGSASGTGGSVTDDFGHSETTTQVEGVDEADIVKTDGKYIYVASRRTEYGCIKIVKAGDTPVQLADIDTPDELIPSDMYLSENRLVVLCRSSKVSETVAVIYDVSKPEEPKQVETCTQSGSLNTSRLIGKRLYVLTNYYINVKNMKKSDTESYIPQISCNGQDGSVAADTVHIYNNCSSPEYTIISAFDISDGTLASTSSVLGGTETVYASTGNIIIAGAEKDNKTEVARFEIIDGKITLMASCELSGSLLNQFSIDEYNGCFRFVLTERVTEETEGGNESLALGTTVNSLVVMDESLKQIGKISDLAPGERIYSVRFMGDTAYFVTFRQVDPLFSADLSDPTNPKIIGSLKIPGFSNYLFPYGDGKLLGIGQNANENTGATEGMKLSMFDISDPSNVTEQDKTDIPAVYAECLYNHKAALVDKDRNLIAFHANGTYKANAFFVYSYENGEFVKRIEAEVEPYSGVCRGIYIGETFYIVTDYEIEGYDMVTFEKTVELTLK